MKARRRARTIALQALYEIDSVGHPAGTVLHHRLEDHNLPEQGIAFVHQLVLGVLKHKDILDPLIQEHAPEWPLDQMACVDRNVLRLALYEFAVAGETPVKVAINEAVELAKLFGSDSSARFVNGVLGALVPYKDDVAEKAQAAQDPESDDT